MSEFATKLNHAKARLTGTATETIPVPFTIACSCGESISGVRRNSWKQEQCEACNELHYVLPVNVYPTSERVPSLVLDGSFFQRLRVVVGEMLAPARDSTVRKSTTQPPPKAQLEDYAPPTRAAEGVPAEDRGEVPVGEAVDDADQKEVLTFSTRPSQSLKTRVLTPFRLLVAGAVLAAVATGWWVTHQNRLESARNQWRTAMDGVDIALEKEDFSDLLANLETAVDAAGVLQRRDTEVLLAENLLLQAKAVTRLSQIDLLNEIDTVINAEPGDRNELVRKLNSTLGGQWFILDCPLKSVQGTSDGVELVIPATSSNLPVRYMVESPWLIRAQGAFVGESLLLAVAIRDVELRPGGRPGLTVNLDPERVALMTESLLVRDTGMIGDTAELESRLAQQEEFLRETRSASVSQESDREDAEA